MLNCYKVQAEIHTENNIDTFRNLLAQKETRKKLLRCLKKNIQGGDNMVSRKEFRTAIVRTLNLDAPKDILDTLFNNDILHGKKHGELPFEELKKMWIS